MQMMAVGACSALVHPGPGPAPAPSDAPAFAELINRAAASAAPAEPSAAGADDGAPPAAGAHPGEAPTRGSRAARGAATDRGAGARTEARAEARDPAAAATAADPSRSAGGASPADGDGGTDEPPMIDAAQLAQWIASLPSPAAPAEVPTAAAAAAAAAAAFPGRRPETTDAPARAVESAAAASLAAGGERPAGRSALALPAAERARPLPAGHRPAAGERAPADGAASLNSAAALPSPAELAAALLQERPAARLQPLAAASSAASLVSADVGRLLTAPSAASVAGDPPPAAVELPTRPLPAPVGSSEFAPALAWSVKRLASEGLQEARLQLQPPEMGPIDVQISVTGHQARVDFVADVAATRAAIESSLPELAAALRESGLTLSGGGVFQQPQPRPGSPSQPAASPRHGDAGAGEEAATALPAPRRASAGVVDLYA